MGDIDWLAMHEEATTILTGDFPVVIVKSEATKSQAGKPQFKLQLAIESGPHAGRKIPTSMTLTADSPGAMKMFFLNLAVLGLDREYFAQQPSPEQIANDLLGRRAVVTLEENNWQGRISERVKTWKAADGGPGGSFGGGIGGLSAVDLDDLPHETEIIPTPVVTSTEMPEDPFAD